MNSANICIVSVKRLESISFDPVVNASIRFILRYPNISFITIATIFSRISGTEMDKCKISHLLECIRAEKSANYWRCGICLHTFCNSPNASN